MEKFDICFTAVMGSNVVEIFRSRRYAEYRTVRAFVDSTSFNTFQIVVIFLKRSQLAEDAIQLTLHRHLVLMREGRPCLG